MSRLDSIFLKYGTSKSSECANFASVYERMLEPLRHTVKKIVEIGIYGTTPANAGASLKAWCEYFPSAMIYGVDIFDYSFLNTDRIKTIVADQGIIENNLEKIISVAGPDIDIIIDDGGHCMHQQQISIGYLYKFLKSGGAYIIEDLQTSYDSMFNPTNTAITTVMMLERLKHDNMIVSEYISDEDKKLIQNTLKYCEIFKSVPIRPDIDASEIAVLFKE